MRVEADIDMAGMTGWLNSEPWQLQQRQRWGRDDGEGVILKTTEELQGPD